MFPGQDRLSRRNPEGIPKDCNGIGAAQVSALARWKAYARRKGTGRANLTEEEARSLRETWYLREMLHARLHGDRASLRQLLREAWRVLPSLRTNRTYLAHLLRSYLM